MKLENYQFTPDEIQRLELYRDQQSDGRLQKRFIALLMIAKGISSKTTREILGIPESTLRNWFNQYIQRGIDALNSFQYKPKASYLSKEQTTELKEWVKKTSQETDT